MRSEVNFKAQRVYVGRIQNKNKRTRQIFECNSVAIFNRKLFCSFNTNLLWQTESATGWSVRRSNSGGGESFLTCPDGSWGPSSLLYNGYWVSCPGVKRPGRGVDRPPRSSAEDKERIELYLYSSSGPSWLVLGWTLLLPFRPRGKKRTYVPVYTMKVQLHGFLTSALDEGE